MIGMLRKVGLSSKVMYAMGFGSIGLSVASWITSKNVESTARADRWGIFVGQWAPTFFALGIAMRLEEQWGGKGTHERVEDVQGKVKDKLNGVREAMPMS